ncbi:hypothetical protein JW933_01115 [candidate division FCPU426 bacterium]|nr:hypothetical protein [candidate division FCPU426 bacterium]
MITSHDGCITRFLITVIMMTITHAAFAAEVISHLDSGAGSLRDVAAAALPGDTITFNIPGGNSITVHSVININKQLAIDGGGVQVIGLLAGLTDNVLAFTSGSYGSTLTAIAVVNGQSGIMIYEDGIIVRNCRIGTDFDNSSGRGSQTGITIQMSTRALIADNIISCNTYGLYITQSSHCALTGNKIGTDDSGMVARPNTTYGIVLVTNSHSNMIGGNWRAGEGNLISGNNNVGVILSQNSMGNTVCGNVIGMNADQSSPMANGVGVQMYVTNFNCIGLPIDGFNNTIAGNSTGINSMGTPAPRENKIQNNAIMNNASGIYFNAGDACLIGGYRNESYQERNLISANTSQNIRIAGNGNTISGNIIGLNWAGDTDISDGDGLYVIGNGNLIGGPNTDVDHIRGNVISGHDGGNHYGLCINQGRGNTVVGNTIGLNLAGTAAIPNLHGIYINHINAMDTYIGGGGDPAVYRNIISGNTYSGLSILNGIRVYIQGNYVGLNQSGTGVVPNTTTGVRILDINDSMIGGMTNDERNHIIGSSTGMYISGTDNSAIVNNYINVMPDGSDSPVAQNVGLLIDYGSQNNHIGLSPSGPGNYFANNVTGIQVDNSDAIYNEISSNTLTGSSSNFIILTNGGNENKSAPNITGAYTTGISGTSEPGDVIQVFQAPGSGQGGAWRVIGQDTADGSGNWNVSAASVVAGQWITALATNANGSTSVFATNREITLPPTATPTDTVTPTVTETPTITPTATESVTFTITPTSTISPTATRTPTSSPTSTFTPTTALGNIDLRGKPALAYPNPAQQTMNFLVHMDHAAKMEIAIYNLAGELITRLSESLPVGNGRVMVWDCGNVAPGIYIARVLEDGEEQGQLKVAIIK